MPQAKSNTMESEESLLENVSDTNNLGYVASYPKFEAVVNHLYDNVFVYFNEGTKKDVLQIIWSTLPSNVYGKYSNRNDRWSKDCILEAFQESENCISVSMEEAIINLTNCKNIPHISNAVTLFLQKNYEERVPVSQTTEICSSCLSITSANPTRTLNVYNTSVNKTDARRKRCESIKIKDVEQRKSPSDLKTWYFTFSAVLILLTLLTGTLYMLYKVSSRLNQMPLLDEPVSFNKTQQTKTTTKMEYFDSGWADHHHPSINMIQMSDADISSAVVKNYDEYKKLLSILTDGQNINLTLSIENQKQWPNDVILNSTDNIVHLSIVGAVTIANIFCILRSTPKLRSLVINNSLDYLCTSDITGKEYNGNMVILLDLKLIHIEKLMECTFFYEELVKHTSISNLHTFRLSRSVVTENNLQNIQKIIKKSKDTIKFLEFPETEWIVSIFDYRIGTLLKLQYLHIDFINRSVHNVPSINKYLDIFFPNLISFTSSIGYISIDQFKHLSDCKNIKYLQLRILIPDSQTEIQLSTMKKFFPSLQSVILYFKFESWETQNKCSIAGLHEIMTQIKKIRIRSNCPMAFK